MGGIVNQLVCSAIATYINMTIWLLIFWPSCTITLFRSETTTLNRPMTETEVALLGSLCGIGALIGNPIAGNLMDKVGRKYTTIFFASAHVISWGLLAIFSTVEVVLAALLLAGFGSAVAITIPTFIGEICHESIRGTMTTVSIVMYSVGMLLSYVLGGSLEYKTMIFTCLVLNMIGVVLLIYLRESPTYLMKIGNDEEAARSFAFYRNAEVESKEVLIEMEKLKRSFNSQLDEKLDEKQLSPEEEKLHSDIENPEKKSKPQANLSFWQFCKLSYPTRRAAYIATSLMTTVIFQGLFAIQMYAKPLFEEAVPNMSATLCTVLLGGVTIVFGCCTAYLTDWAGRRPLLIYSAIATGIICIALGSQLQFYWAPQWVTALLIYMFTGAFSFGSGSVVYLLLTEVFLPEVKSLMTMYIIQWSWLCDSIALFIFTPLTDAWGLGPVIYIFATSAFLTALITFFFLPETKGVPVDQIQYLFAKGRSARA